MDIQSLLFAAVGLLLGIGGVGAFVSKIANKVDSIIIIVSEVLDVVQVSVASLKDGNLTKEEQQKIAKELTEAIQAIKSSFKEKVK